MSARVGTFADFRVTVNRALVQEQYLLPSDEDIFATLAGGSVLTELDFTGAYTQLKINEPAQVLLTVNRYIGLYRYKTMVYGIFSAPSIFQSVKDRILLGVLNVNCYLKDN